MILHNRVFGHLCSPCSTSKPCVKPLICAVTINLCFGLCLCHHSPVPAPVPVYHVAVSLNRRVSQLPSPFRTYRSSLATHHLLTTDSTHHLVTHPVGIVRYCLLLLFSFNIVVTTVEIARLNGSLAAILQQSRHFGHLVDQSLSFNSS